MTRSGAHCGWVVVLAAIGCGGSDEAPAPTTKPPPASTECGAFEVEALDGTCVPVGVPPEACAGGFEPDGEAGCRAILPAAPCPPGQMAIPGEAQCRPIQPCGSSKWGDFAEGASVWVDAAYPGADSDGSEARPWTTIQDAVQAAAEGATIAIAAGEYTEVVWIAKTVHLRGRCPEMVTIEYPGLVEPAITLFVRGAAHGTTVAGVGVTGNSIGVAVSDALDVLLERIRIYDTSERGLVVQDSFGPASATLRDSSIERASDLAVLAGGVTLGIERSVLLDTQPSAAGDFGYAISAVMSPSGARAALSVRRSVIAGGFGALVQVSGSDADVEASLVRDVLAVVGGFGAGIDASMDPASGAASKLRVAGSVLERVQDVGIGATGGELVVDSSTIQDVHSDLTDTAHGGIIAFASEGLPVSATITSSRVQDVTSMGVAMIGATAGIDRLFVRRSIGGANDAIGVLGQDGETIRTNLTLSASLVEDQPSVGVVVMGSDALLEAVSVRTNEGSSANGPGIYVQRNGTSLELASATIRGGTIERATRFGVAVLSSSAVLEGTNVIGTRADEGGLFGDGISVLALDSGAPQATITGVRVDGSARVGISSFGADVTVGTSSLLCNPIQLAKQAVSIYAPKLADAGGNVCGCDGEGAACQVVVTDLEPPEPLP